MTVISSTQTIRQQRAGTFSRPEDGSEPFAHINSEKIDSVGRRMNRSIYVQGEKSVTFDKIPLQSDFPNIFDYDAGLRLEVEKISGSENNKEEKKETQHVAQEERVHTANGNKRLIDEWV
jgi:hypothetical protein